MAGSWSNSYQASLTLPTGATSGARIVLDGASSELLVYDMDGNLIGSISPVDTTDPEGNTVYQGIVNYAGEEYVQLGFGNLILGVQPDPNDPAFQPQVGLVGVVGDSSAIFLQSATNQDLPHIATMLLRGGDTTKPVSDPDYPHAAIGDSSQGTALWSEGPLIKADLNGNLYTWQTPTFASGWSSATTLNGNTGFLPMEFRMMGEDDVWVLGAATSSGTGATLFTLPAAYRPPAGARCLLDAYFFTGSAVVAGHVQVTEAGAVAANASLSGVTPAAGLQVFVNGKFPLKNVA